jgi:hypothetical protein
MYALAAGAAGVSALALASPAEAKIIYTPTHHVIRVGDKYNLDLYQHGQADFVLFNTAWNTTTTFVQGPGADLGIRGAQSGNGVANGTNSCFAGCNAFPARAYHKGSAIAPTGSGIGTQFAAFLIWNTSGGSHGGWYGNKKNLYVGLVFYIGEESHFGWARISVSGNGDHGKWKTVGTLTGYAFETVPNRPIIAGKTKGPDVITLQPATLGRLALGKK